MLGDSNSCMEDFPMKTFGEIYKLRNLTKEPICFKNPENPTCIDLTLTNQPVSFKNTYVIQTVLSDFHKMIVAVMKMHFPKMKPQFVSYRKYKDFHNETFLDSLRHELNVQGQLLNEKGLDVFSTISTEIFDKHAPKKKRYIRYNHKPFISNEISKATMTRSRLRNRFLKNRNEQNRKIFCKQKNKCVSLLRISKKDYFENLNEKNITDSKRFSKTVKPFLSKKNHLPERINLTEEENNSLLTNCEEVAKELNNVFANAVKNLNTLNHEKL